MVLLIASASPAQPSAAKGYELYSWKRDGDWYFALLVGTNRAKSYEEVTSSSTAIKGTKALKAALDNLPKGAQVFWQSDLKPGVRKPTEASALNITLPSSKRVKRLIDYCTKKGLKMSLV